MRVNGPMPLGSKLQEAYIGEYETRGHPGSWGVRQIYSRGELRRDHGLRVIELNKVFWRPGLVATPRDQWVAVQESFVAEDGWTMDGDLGPYDVVESGCVRRTRSFFWTSRSPAMLGEPYDDRASVNDFWRWVVKYRWQSRPILMQSIVKHAANADLHVFRNPQALSQFVAKVAWEAGPG